MGQLINERINRLRMIGLENDWQVIAYDLVEDLFNAKNENDEADKEILKKYE